MPLEERRHGLPPHLSLFTSVDPEGPIALDKEVPVDKSSGPEDNVCSGPEDNVCCHQSHLEIIMGTTGSELCMWIQSASEI